MIVAWVIVIVVALAIVMFGIGSCYISGEESERERDTESDT